MFETESLILRARDPDLDLNFLHQLYNDASYLTNQTCQPLPPPRTRNSLKAALASPLPPSKLPCFIICAKSPSNTLHSLTKLRPDDDYAKACGTQIGCLNFFNSDFDFKNRVAYVSIGFLRAEDRGKGLGTEVLRWGMEYAFMELGLHRVQLECYSFNLGALACYRKVGFIEEGRMRKTYFKTGEWHDTIVMAMLDEEWIELRKWLK